MSSHCVSCGKDSCATINNFSLCEKCLEPINLSGCPFCGLKWMYIDFLNLKWDNHEIISVNNFKFLTIKCTNSLKIHTTFYSFLVNTHDENKIIKTFDDIHEIQKKSGYKRIILNADIYRYYAKKKHVENIFVARKLSLEYLLIRKSSFCHLYNREYYFRKPEEIIIKQFITIKLCFKLKKEFINKYIAEIILEYYLA